MKKKALSVVAIWVVILVISFVTAPDLKIGSRFLYTLIFAVIGWIGICLGIGQKKIKRPNRKGLQYSAEKQKCIYIFRGTERQFLYRYDGKYIYSGMSDKFVYRIVGNKIYKGSEEKYSYRLAGNKIYRGLEKQPLYRIDGNYIYSGDFGRQPVFRMSDSNLI